MVPGQGLGQVSSPGESLWPHMQETTCFFVLRQVSQDTAPCPPHTPVQGLSARGPSATTRPTAPRSMATPRPKVPQGVSQRRLSAGRAAPWGVAWACQLAGLSTAPDHRQPLPSMSWPLPRHALLIIPAPGPLHLPLPLQWNALSPSHLTAFQLQEAFPVYSSPPPPFSTLAPNSLSFRAPRETGRVIYLFAYSLLSARQTPLPKAGPRVSWSLSHRGDRP